MFWNTTINCSIIFFFFFFYLQGLALIFWRGQLLILRFKINSCSLSISKPLGIAGKRITKYKDMFGNCFFPLFSVFKNNFLFLKLKNLFHNPKWTKNKNCSQNSICERNWKYTNCCFQFLIFKSQWKYTFNLMNLSYLMS